MAALRGDTPIQYVRGVGPRRAEAFARLGLKTVSDLLEYLPFRYERVSSGKQIALVRDGDRATIGGEVTDIDIRPGRCLIQIYDGSATCELVWFNPDARPRGVVRGCIIEATGEVHESDYGLQMVQPRVVVHGPDAAPRKGEPLDRMVGVYRGSPQLKSPAIQHAVQNVLAEPALPVEEALPTELLRRRRLLTRADALRAMHMPRSQRAVDEARRRLAYEELLLLELAMALRRRKALATHQGAKLHLTPEIDQRIRARFPFSLTAAQDDAIREICADLGSGRPMTRLLQGDVGSGKTVVALYACLVAVANGRQAAIMAPTEILARQHFRNIEQYLAGSRVRHVLLHGGMAPRARAEALAAVERGEIDLVVGTQALIQRDVAFHQLAVVVVDEQHKFGVLQRHTFRTKGPMPHYLVMTATPIPRTLAMTVFGDLDVSLIRSLPPGRGCIITRVVTADQWNVVMDYVYKRLAAGEQAYVVCPQIGRDENEPRDADRPGDETPGRPPRPDAAPSRRNLVSVRNTFDRLTAGPWKDLRVALLHGSLPAREQQQIVADFVAGRTHALVATTVVEVGVDVPNATIMVVEHADRFGLSQLHQLRGRIGRGVKDSLCVLVAYDAGRDAAALARARRTAAQQHAARRPAPNPRAPVATPGTPGSIATPGTRGSVATPAPRDPFVTSPHGGSVVAPASHDPVGSPASRVPGDSAASRAPVGSPASRGPGRAPAPRAADQRAPTHGASPAAAPPRAPAADHAVHDWYAFLPTADRASRAVERLMVMAETTDGFRIAEADLRHRGPGQLFGTKQHGLPELRFADLVEDFALLETARQDAFAIVARDPQLKLPEHARLVPALRTMFGEKLALIDAA